MLRFSSDRYPYLNEDVRKAPSIIWECGGGEEEGEYDFNAGTNEIYFRLSLPIKSAFTFRFNNQYTPNKSMNVLIVRFIKWYFD